MKELRELQRKHKHYPALEYLPYLAVFVCILLIAGLIAYDGLINAIKPILDTLGAMPR